MNSTKESEETLRRQVEETVPAGLKQEKPTSPGTGGPGGSEGLPPTSLATAPAVPGPIPENLRALVEEILEEATTREVPSWDEQQKRLSLIGSCIKRGLEKSNGKIINYGNKPDNYLYLEANVVFSIARQARCEWGPLRLGNGKGYEREVVEGEVEIEEAGQKKKGRGPVTIYYTEAFATCPILGTSVGLPPGAGVGVFVTSEDKFLKGTKKSAGTWGHERNMMQTSQTRSMRKALVKILGLDALTEKVLSEILGRKPVITPVTFGG